MAMGPLRIGTSSLRKAASAVATSQRRGLSIHEYQAQGLLSEYGVPVPKGYLCTSSNEVKKHVSNHGGQAVVKAQILAGGRGKGTFENGYQGGVQVVTSSVAQIQLIILSLGNANHGNRQDLKRASELHQRCSAKI